MSNDAPVYRACLVGLTGIGASRPAEVEGLPLYGAMPGSHAAAYAAHPRTELVGVCDLQQSLLDDFAGRWSDVWPEMGYYTDFGRMLEETRPDLVSIATSDHAHAAICVQAAQSGARAIFCEKPIATSLADADAMIAACDEAGVLLSVDHTRRWDPAFLEARRIIQSGAIGPLRSLHVELYSRRAMLFRNGTHMIDLLCFFAGSNPVWVSAELEEGFEDFTEYRGDGGRDPGTDPSAAAYIRFEGGIRAYFNADKMDFPGSQLTLICEQGRIEISDREARLIRGTSNSEWSASVLQPPSFQQQRQLAAVAELLDVLENGGTLVSDGREARKTLEIILGMLRSHHEGNRRVDLPL